MLDEQRDIAIVGISVYTPAGSDPDSFWSGLARGGDFITEVPPDVIEEYHFTGEPNGLDRFYCNRGGFCDAFKVDLLRYGILPIAADGAEPDQLVSMAGTERALMDADIFEKGISLNKCSLIIGKGNFSGSVSLRVFEILRTARQVEALMKIALPELTDDDLRRIREAYQKLHGRYQPDIATGTMPSLVASLAANRFDMHGPAYSMDAACASGILAIEHSIANLRSGACDVAVAGGMHSGQSSLFWGPFDLIGAVSHRGVIAPFSKDADGLLIGQGGGFLVLKTLRRALEDEDRIYAIIKDTAVGSDGHGSHPLVTSVDGQVRVLKKAWDRAGMDPKRIGYVEAHGTGTPAGDRVEVTTLKEFFGDNSHQPALVGSVKSNIGHTMPAAGMIGIIKAALALYNRQIPPTLHCEDPLPAMFESRFLPAQELVEWDEDRYPLVAGVNAFGFGGINSHAILVPYEPAVGMPPAIRPRRQPTAALKISARTAEALVEKLQTGDFTHTGGDYRIVVFDPTEKRIELALSIVEEGKPWRGQMGIWFSHEALLTNGGKVAYLCPGFSMEGPSETDSISEMLKLPRVSDLLSKEDDDWWVQFMLHYFYIVWLCREALGKLGHEPDLYAGNSTGEWGAALFAGITEGTPSELFGPMLSHVPTRYSLIAVPGIGSDEVEQLLAEIPELYLAAENSPSEVLLCGDEATADALLERLKEKNLLYTVMPYGSGIHTPLMALPDDAYGAYVDSITVKEGTVPAWSSTTLEPIPANKKDYTELFKAQLTQPGSFRRLIEKLYDEQGVRVFVQLGVGNLPKYVSDTLEGKDFSVVGSCAAGVEGADQLRQVLAALFVEGRDVDSRFLGVDPQYTVDHSLTRLSRGAPPLITEMPELAEIVTARYGARGPQPATAEGGDTLGNPLLATANANMQDAIKVQNELLQLFEQLPVELGSSVSPTGQTVVSRGQTVVSTDAAAPQTTTATRKTAAPEVFEEAIHLTFEDHPYLIDHSIIRQPRDWDCQDDLNIVVPLTMTIELLAEAGLRYAGGRKLLKMKNISAYRWVEVERGFEGTMRVTRKKPHILDVELLGHAKAELEFGEEWPEPPEEFRGVLDLGEQIMPNRSAQELYEQYAFHGPQYQSNTVMLGIHSRGTRSLAERKEGKGSLLDITGQQLGLFLHLTQTKAVISFPVRIKELSFYADFLDQDGVFECSMLIKKTSDLSITADMVLKREEKIWGTARGFVCQRFESAPVIWHIILRPQSTLLADQVAPGVYHFANRSRGNALPLLEKRYMTYAESSALKDASTAQRREYLTGCIALKDAVRAFVASAPDDLLYPIEVFSTQEGPGSFSVHGREGKADALKGLHVSLAQKDEDAVAMVADHPIGVGLEKIEEKSEDFLASAFTERERELLASLEQPKGSALFGAAKQACAGKQGIELQDNPTSLEVSAIDGDVLYVGEQGVQTLLTEGGYVIGWTL
ncbi:MAG: hypothetical protein LBP24_03060 [Coriobacteriales bacterium]|jgi:acyl transferase domain-containing protein/phosphopantetheinyl transferase (holo-ACP synthase)|nr:hypothetical protein [Coriobacteriales bacterium]